MYKCQTDGLGKGRCSIIPFFEQATNHITVMTGPYRGGTGTRPKPDPRVWGLPYPTPYPKVLGMNPTRSSACDPETHWRKQLLKVVRTQSFQPNIVGITWLRDKTRSWPGLVAFLINIKPDPDLIFLHRFQPYGTRSVFSWLFLCVVTTEVIGTIL